MLKKNKVARIHELYEKEHASIKTICKILNISRNTVRRYLRETEFKGYETPQLAYLRNNRAEVRAIFNSCNKRCTAMLPILEERTGLKFPLRTLQRFRSCWTSTPSPSAPLASSPHENRGLLGPRHSVSVSLIHKTGLLCPWDPFRLSSSVHLAEEAFLLSKITPVFPSGEKRSRGLDRIRGIFFGF